MGGDHSSVFAFSYRQASTLAAAGRAEPSGAEVERSAQGEQVQQIPPSSDRADATARRSGVR